MSLETRNISRKVFRKCPVTVRNQWERKQHVQPQVVGSETGDPETLGVRSVGGAEGGPHDDDPPPGVATPAPRSQGLGPRPGQTGAWTSSKVSCYWSLPLCYLSVTESRWFRHDLAILQLIINILHRSQTKPYKTCWKQGTLVVSAMWWMETKLAILLIGIMRKVRIQNIWERASETHFLVPLELEPNNWGNFILTPLNVYLHIGPRLLYDLRTCKMQPVVLS